MRTLQKTIGTLVGLSGILCVGVAHADVYACNQTSHNMWVIAGFFGNGDNLGCANLGGIWHDEPDLEWVGWYYAAANSCVQMWHGCYNTGDQPYMAYYANNDIGQYWAGNGLNGEYSPLMQTNSAFKCCVPMYNDKSDPYDTCASGEYPNGTLTFAGPRVFEVYGSESCIEDVTVNFTE